MQTKARKKKQIQEFGNNTLPRSQAELLQAWYGINKSTFN
jgi:hypothetical protein